MKSVLVTGGLGFIGSNFIKHIFNKYDYYIHNVDLKTYAANYSNINKEINQSGRYSLSICDINDTDRLRNLINKNNFYDIRLKRTKMINSRSNFNQFAFHLSNPIMIIFRNIFLKLLTKNKKFLESYLGKIYKS